MVKQQSTEMPVNESIELEELAEDCTTVTPILVANTFLNQCSDCNGSFKTERDLNVYIKMDYAAAVEKTKDMSSQTEFF